MHTPSLLPLVWVAPHRLLWGIPGRSNALNIAQRLGLDAEVVAAARGKLGTEVAQVCGRGSVLMCVWLFGRCAALACVPWDLGPAV